MSAPQRLLNQRLMERERGWPYCRQSTMRLVDEGRLAPPRKLPGSHINWWTDQDIDAFYSQAVVQKKDKEQA
jgi:hypothetical protein